MKKTFKEKFLELKKENEFLHIILKDKVSDYRALEFEFFNFKKDLKDRQDKENKNFFIFSIIGLSLLTLFSILTLF